MIGYYSKRSKKMETIAIKYGLNFENPKIASRFEFLTNKKLNRIYGVINNYRIEIYDFITHPHDCWSPFCEKYYTVFLINGSRYPIKAFFWGFPMARIIERWLKSMTMNKFYIPKNYALLYQIIFFLISIFLVLFFVL